METPEALSKRLFRKTKSQLVDEIASLRGLVATDVTERKQVEETLRESEARFRQLFEQAPIAIIREDWSEVKAAVDELRRKGVADIGSYLQSHPDEAASMVDGINVLDVNDTTVSLFRTLDKDAFIAFNKVANYAEDELRIAVETIIAFAGGATRRESEVKQLAYDGAMVDTIMVDRIVSGCEDDWRTVIVTIADVTERKRAEEALRESEARLVHAAQMAKLGYWVWDEIEDKATQISDELAAIFGYASGEEFTPLLSSSEADVEWVYPADRDRYRAAVSEAKENKSGFDIEYRAMAREGEVRHVREVLEPVLDECGTLVRSNGIVQDVTQQRMAEQALREAHDELERRVEERTQELAEASARLRVALDHMPGGMMVLDRDQNYVVVNDQYAQLHDFPDGIVKEGGSLVDELRYQAKRGDFGPGNIDDLVDDDIALFNEDDQADHERTIPGGRTLQFKRATTAGGGTVTICTDITERKRTEEALEESEARYRELFDESPVAVWEEDWTEIKRMLDQLAARGVKDWRRYFTRRPEQLAKAYDLTRGVEISRAMLEMYRAPDKQALYDMVDSGKIVKAELERFLDTLIAFLSENWSIEYEHPDRKFDGEEWVIQARAVVPPKHRGDWSRVIYAVEDITERKRAEVALRESEERAKAILNTAFQLQGLLNPDGTLIEANAAALSMIGARPEDVAGLPFWDCPWWADDPEIQIQLRKAVERAVRGETVQFVTMHITPDGSVRHIDFRMTPVRDKNGNVVLLVPEGHDVTELKRAEAELAEKEAHLRVALETMPGGMMMFDKDLRVILFNEQYMQHLDFPDGLVSEGDPAEKILRYQAERGDYGPGDVDGLADKAMATLMSGEPSRLERKLSTGRVLEIGLAPTPEGGMVAVFSDITERHRAEVEALAAKDRAAAAEAQLRGAIDSMSEGFVLFDADDRLVVCNSPYLTMFPHATVGATYEEILDLGIARGVFFGTEEEVAKWRGERLAEHDNPKGEMFLQHLADGRWINTIERRTAEGGLVGIRADVTEFKRVEQELRENENLLNKAARMASLGHYVYDHVENKLAQVSDELARIAGISVDEFMSNPADTESTIEKWIHPDDREFVREAIYEADGLGEPHDVEYRIVRTDGEVRYVRAVGEPTRAGSDAPVRSFGMIQDITERKHAEEALMASAERLRQREQFLRTVVDTIPAAINIRDTEGRFVLTNQTLADFYGVDLKDWIGEIPDLTIPGSAVEKIEEREFRQVVETGVAAVDTEYQYGEEGEEEYWLTTRQPIHDDDGKLLYVLTVSNEITERKRAEEELRVARDQAESATQAKAQFLATMSHEIRTPMNGVIGMVDLLQQTKLDADQRQMMTTVHESAYSLLTIINDILDFSKIEAGKLDLENIPVSISDVVEGVGETLASNARTKGIGLSTYIDPAIPDAILGDQTRIRQILFNLGGNAVKFTRYGKVLIRADRLPSKAKSNVTVRFQVIDSGIGIPKNKQKALFQAFSQAEASTARRFGGTGLGLSICQRLVTMMKGSIEVESKARKGSTFTVTVTLPVAEEHTIKSDGLDLSGLNVLLVVRDDNVRELLPRYLEHWNAEVTTAEQIGQTKRLALDAAARGKPFDVIILGSGWPLRKQAHVIESVHDAEELSETHFVLMTRSRTKSDRKEIAGTVYVDAQPMRRAGFIRAIAVAAGRASPDVDYDEDSAVLAGRTAPTVDEAAARGELILLAEDNLTNQRVILRQLNLLGYAAEVANDGKEALKAVRSGSYAMLLTDCHMPNMDGYELAEAVRKAEKKGGARLPIVAITAGVLKAEMDRCFESGMDDYLAKPLAVSKLNDVLRKWMPVPEFGATDAAPAAAGPTDDQPHLVDPNVLRKMFGDDTDTIRELLAEYLVTALETVAKTEEAYQRKSAQEISDLTHDLKSSSQAIGAYALSDLCATLQRAGKASDWATIESDMPDLRARMNEVAEFIAKQS